ncbi:helix-turn-helix transcriptional regulator [Phycicoccus avicenniae]|uniref:helix-turn-helix transcriptional regulator n=1 Tax=Phycicoccus avicenniae TaxID=2828860 RepID=UPI003D29EE0F
MPGPAVDLFLRTVEPLLRHGDPVVARLGDRRELPEVFARLEAGTERSMWNMQVQVGPWMARRTRRLNDTMRARSVDERMVHDLVGARRHPLATTLDPQLRVGAVVTQLMVLDERYAVLPGLPGAAGVGATHGTDDPDLVALAAAAFLETWDAAVPWSQAGLRPPLPPRRFEVAALLMDGHADREIAEELGVSERTVSADIRAVVDWLGARNRGHAVAMLVGAA